MLHWGLGLALITVILDSSHLELAGLSARFSFFNTYKSLQKVFFSLQLFGYFNLYLCLFGVISLMESKPGSVFLIFQWKKKAPRGVMLSLPRSIWVIYCIILFMGLRLNGAKKCLPYFSVFYLDRKVKMKIFITFFSKNRFRFLTKAEVAKASYNCEL